MTRAKARQAGGKGPVRVWLVRLAKFLAGLFVGLHLYAALLVFLPVPGTVLMVQRAAGGEHLRRRMTPIEDISPYLVSAVIAAEDTRFCQHHGVDPEAIEKAIGEYKKGKKARGASTITQQTAKNVFFWNGGGAPRKLGDMWMATFIDHVWGKRRVMEVYLNVAEWGDGIFGAEAAAQARFGKPASKLTEREAALLAAREGRDQVDNQHLDRARDKIVLGEQREALLTEEERKRTAYHEARRLAAGADARGAPPGPRCLRVWRHAPGAAAACEG